MEKSGFFNSVDNDRVYNAQDFADFYGDFLLNGVVYASHDSLRVAADIGFTVTVLPGNAFIKGYKYYNTAPLSITLDETDGIHSRIDVIAVRYDEAARSIYLTVLNGVPAVDPVPPEVTQGSSVYELGIAQVYIHANTDGITDEDITDTRMDYSVCGSSRVRSYLVHGEADTEALTDIILDIQTKLNAGYYTPTPDYANMDTTSRIVMSYASITPSQWTVEEDGFVRCYISIPYFASSAGNVQVFIYINGRVVGYEIFENLNISTAQCGVLKAEGVYSVSAGDVISFNFSRYGTITVYQNASYNNGILGCYFIPRKAVME